MGINGIGLVCFVEHTWDVLCWGTLANVDKIVIFLCLFSFKCFCHKINQRNKMKSKCLQIITAPNVPALH